MNKRNNRNGWGNASSRTLLALAAMIALAAGGCYSFRTGSAPAHLRSIGIPPADDVSGFGRGTIRLDLTELLLRRFRDDNSLNVVDAASADSRLEVVISALRTNERLNVSGAEFETVRGVYIEARATFYDNLRKRAIFKDRQVQGRAQYRVSEGPSGENTAIAQAMDKLADELLNTTVADW